MSTRKERVSPGNNLSRRELFDRAVDGLHGTALACLLGKDLFDANRAMAASVPRIYDLKAKPPQFKPRAKSVIQLFMNGGPSQVDLFDPKPALQKFAGQPPSRHPRRGSCGA